MRGASSLLVSLALALLLSLAAPSLAGTAEDPEVTDGINDVTFEGQPACAPSNPAPANPCPGPVGFANLRKGWVADESETAIVLTIDSADNANVYGDGLYEFRFTVGATDYVAGMLAGVAPANGAAPPPEPTGVASSAEFVDTLMVITVPRVAIGSPAAGTLMTKLHVTALVTTEVGDLEDRAPDADFGRDYTFLMGAAASGSGNMTAGGNVTAGTNSTAGASNTSSSPTSAQGGATSSAAPTTASAATGSGSPTNAAAGNATSGQDAAASSSDGKKTPSLALPAFAAAVGVALVLHRRRMA